MEKKITNLGLPENYLPVLVVSSRSNKKIGMGVLDKSNSIHSLYIFSENEGVLIYTKNEVREFFVLSNPDDGFEYDLNKIL